MHVAIVNRHASSRLLDGRKRIESRFYRRPRAPFGRIHAGDIVHFKLSGGGLIGTARVTHVCQYAGLTPRRIGRLHQRYRRRVCAPARFWAQRRGCRYGVLVWIARLARPPIHLRVPRQYGSGWLVLSE